MEPNSDVWTSATIVTMATVGRATSHSDRMWPMPRAPISSTTRSVPSGAFRRVSGTPISLLKLFSLAAVRKLVASAAARRSLTDVLPTDPVMPVTCLWQPVACHRAEPGEGAHRVVDPHGRGGRRGAAAR